MAWAADATEASRGGNRPWGAGVLGMALRARSLPLEDTERAEVVEARQKTTNPTTAWSWTPAAEVPQPP